MVKPKKVVFRTLSGLGFLLRLFAISLVSLSHAKAQSDGATVSTACALGQKCSVVPQTMPNVRNTDILWYGEAFSDPNAKITKTVRAKFEPSLARFPDLASCVEGDTRDQAALQSAILKWDDFETPEDRAVCFTRLFSMFESLDDISAWLKWSGFTVPEPSLGEAWVTAPNLPPDMYILTATFIPESITEAGEKWRHMKPSAMGANANIEAQERLFRLHHSASVYYQEPYGVLQVNARQASKFSK